MPLYYQSFKNYAQMIADKTTRHGLHVSPLPEIWDLSVPVTTVRTPIRHLFVKLDAHRI